MSSEEIQLKLQTHLSTHRLIQRAQNANDHAIDFLKSYLPIFPPLLQPRGVLLVTECWFTSVQCLKDSKSSIPAPPFLLLPVSESSTSTSTVTHARKQRLSASLPSPTHPLSNPALNPIHSPSPPSQPETPGLLT